VFFMLFTFSSIGLPGLNGFVGEFMILAGSFQRAWSGVSPAWSTAYLTLALVAVGGVVLGAWYMLQAVQRVFFGPSREPPRADHDDHQHGHGSGHGSAAGPSNDLRWHELAALAPLAVFVVWIGVAPGTFLAPVSKAVRTATDNASYAFDSRMATSGPADEIAAEPSRSPALSASALAP
jgi:NADH-quinone oxidoreductase subunit M